MVTVTMIFEPIKIVSLDVGATEDSGQGALKNLSLKLSKFAEYDWCEQFNHLWKNHFYMMKRAAYATGDRLVVTCVPDELSEGLLEELKKVVEATNVAYGNHIQQQNTQQQQKVTAENAETAKLNELASKLKF